MTPERRHLSYAYLLYNGLTLYEDHARQIAKAWYGYESPDTSFEYGERRWATDIYSRIYFDGIRSVPDPVYSLVVLSEIKDRVELEGVPGLYFEGGLWRLNVDPSRGAILKPYRSPDNLIAGLLIYKHLGDARPVRLSSKGLPKGAAATEYLPERTYA